MKEVKRRSEYIGKIFNLGEEWTKKEEEFFRIFDSKKDIVGYFDPDYGELFPKEKESEIIDQMHKNHDKIPGGFLMVPLVKFGIFDKFYQSWAVQIRA